MGETNKTNLRKMANMHLFCIIPEIEVIAYAWQQYPLRAGTAKTASKDDLRNPLRLIQTHYKTAETSYGEAFPPFAPPNNYITRNKLGGKFNERNHDKSTHSAA